MAQQADERPLVIALHCSGANAAEWAALGALIADSHALVVPEQYGSGDMPSWPGPAAFTLADEAARSIALIDRTALPVHLVGHSYGGGVALQVAVARPNRIASLSLYEPSPFHLLPVMGPDGARGHAEIAAAIERVAGHIRAGENHRAAAGFIDYWNGPGGWDRLRPAVQNAMAAWIPDVTNQLYAALNETTPIDAYAALQMPVLVIRGEHAPTSTRVIAEHLPRHLPHCATAVIAGAGHMGPFTHADDVNRLIAAHIRERQ